MYEPGLESRYTADIYIYMICVFAMLQAGIRFWLEQISKRSVLRIDRHAVEVSRRNPWQCPLKLE